MMKSRLSLKSPVKRGLLLNLSLLTLLILGCSTSTTPKYLKEDVPEVIQDICKKEYNIDVKVKLVGQTLWTYLAVEDMFSALDSDEKPSKYLEKFAIEHNEEKFQYGDLKLEYIIKVIPEKEKYQEYKYNKTVLKKINNVFSVLRRVIFNIDRSQADEIKFFCQVSADIKSGFQIKEISYYLDLKKISYRFISLGEYRHRAIQEVNMVPEAIGDKEGAYLKYKDITMKEFIAGQIKHRIALKFQKPEVKQTADIDKEIIKIAVYTIKTYNFQDFSRVEFNNLLTNNRIILNRQAILARPMD